VTDGQTRLAATDHEDLDPLHRAGHDPAARSAGTPVPGVARRVRVRKAACRRRPLRMAPSDGNSNGR
jgi:hypothetical protein